MVKKISVPFDLLEKENYTVGVVRQRVTNEITVKLRLSDYRVLRFLGLTAFQKDEVRKTILLDVYPLSMRTWDVLKLNRE